jgi:dipeptidyl aminopeptidase/acylaminoacyl peptidase
MTWPTGRPGGLRTLVLESFLGSSSARSCTQASPITHAGRGSAPTLLIHGTDDRVVPFAQSEVFARKLREAGAHVRLHTLHNAGHGFGSGPRDRDREANRTALEFLDRHFTPRAHLPAIRLSVTPC